MKTLAALLLLTLTVGAVMYWRDAPVMPATVTRSEPIALSIQPPRPERKPLQSKTINAVQHSMNTPLPPSFAGTQVDGRLRTDAAGNLIIKPDIRQVFDYFLASIGEEPLPASVTRLQRYMQAQLPEPATRQATQLLSQYLDYKRQLLMLENDHARQPDLDAMRARLSAVRDLRASIFNAATHQAFFALEEAADAFTLERLALRHDQTLSASEQGAALDNLRSNLPPELQDTPALQLQSELRERTGALKASGASSADLRQLRQQLVGNVAADRLEQLDAKRRDWQRRVIAYRQDKIRILNSRGLGDADKQAAIQHLTAQRFDESERLRLEAAEQLLTQDKG